MRGLLLATAATLGASCCMAGVARAQAAPSPAPGTITVHLNGKLSAYVGAAFESDFNTPATPGNVGGKVDQDVGVGSFMHLYPAFDAVAANGLKYGAKIDLWSNNGAGNPVTASPSGQSYSRGSVFVRRAYGYIGTDKLGQIQFGQNDGPASQFLLGTMENFNDGGWDGDAPGMIVGNGELTWPWADGANGFESEKITYLSPQFYGFDFGFSYDPTTNGSSVSPGCNVGGTGCMLLSSTNGPDYNRARNTVEAALRYQGSFGPLGLSASGIYVGSGKVGDSATPPQSPQYDGLSIGDIGTQLTYGGLTVGGNIQFGRFNDDFQLVPKGAASGLAWIAGASYGVGPWIVGASYYNYKSAGDPVAPGQRDEQGIAAGGTYTLAPGLALYLDYLWGQRKQGGYNFVTGDDTGPASLLHNTVAVQYVGVGSSLSW